MSSLDTDSASTFPTDPNVRRRPGTFSTNSKSPHFDRYWLHRLVFLRQDNTSATKIQEQDDNSTTTTTSFPDRPLYIAAPMVDASELPFRLLCRKYQCDVCFTPMIHAKLFGTSKNYRAKFALHETIGPRDRPLLAQLCGSNSQHLWETAQAIAPYCDGIDLNCGCPQNIARRGHYGAFLLEETDTLVNVVQELVAKCETIHLPVSVKVRLLPGETREERLKKSLHLYKRLVNEAGIAMLTVHGRTRYQKGPLTGSSDWDAIATIVQILGDKIPIIANGGIDSLESVYDCYQHTKVDGVMSSEAILEYPPLFASLPDSVSPNGVPTPIPRIGRTQLALEYLQLANEYPPNVHGQGSGLKSIRLHIHRFLHADLQVHTNIRQLIIDAESCDDMTSAIRQLETIHRKDHHVPEQETLSWYLRFRQEGCENNDTNTLDVDKANSDDEPADKSLETIKYNNEMTQEEEDAMCCDVLFK